MRWSAKMGQENPPSLRLLPGLSRRIVVKSLWVRIPSRFQTPIVARTAGIGAVYQDPKLFAHLDVAENIFMGAYPTTITGTVDRKTMYERAALGLRQLGLDLDPRSLIAGLSVAELQFVEIARALLAELQLLILDDPTSALTPAESERLFKIIRTLRDRDKTVLLIKHTL